MKHTAIALIASLVAFSGGAEAREVTTKIGSWRTNSGGGINFSVIDINGHKAAIVFASDKHTINTNFYRVDSRELKKIRALIDETIDTLDASRPGDANFVGPVQPTE